MTSKLPINLADLLRLRTDEGERIDYKASWNPGAFVPIHFLTLVARKLALYPKRVLTCLKWV